MAVRINCGNRPTTDRRGRRSLRGAVSFGAEEAAARFHCRCSVIPPHPVGANAVRPHSLTNIIPTAPRGVLSRQALFHSLMGASPSASFNFACHKNPHPWSRRFLSEYAKMGQGIGLQTGCRPSKANNEAASKHIRSKTGLDYICQAMTYSHCIRFSSFLQALN